MLSSVSKDTMDHYALRCQHHIYIYIERERESLLREYWPPCKLGARELGPVRITLAQALLSEAQGELEKLRAREQEASTQLHKLQSRACKQSHTCFGPTHRLHSSSFLGLAYMILNMNPKRNYYGASR